MGKIILPQPDEITKRDKDDAMGAYLMMFAAMGAGLPLPLINLLAAVIYYYINKKKSRYVAFHAYQSLITQIPISVLNAGLLFWLLRILLMTSPVFNSSFFIYLSFAGLWNLIYMVLSIVASVKARRGHLYYMLLFGPIAFNRFYGKIALERQLIQDKDNSGVNLPPSGF
jgi:uncharacterized membrane protein